MEKAAAIDARYFVAFAAGVPVALETVEHEFDQLVSPIVVAVAGPGQAVV